MAAMNWVIGLGLIYTGLAAIFPALIGNSVQFIPFILLALGVFMLIFRPNRAATGGLIHGAIILFGIAIIVVAGIDLWANLFGSPSWLPTGTEFLSISGATGANSTVLKVFIIFVGVIALALGHDRTVSQMGYQRT